MQLPEAINRSSICVAGLALAVTFLASTRWKSATTEGRHHDHETDIQRAATRAAGIAKHVHCHTFRHSLATYLLERAHDPDGPRTPCGVRSPAESRINKYPITDPRAAGSDTLISKHQGAVESLGRSNSELTYHSFRMSTSTLIRLLSAWWRGIPLQPSSPEDAAESGWKETWSTLLEGMVGEFAFVRVEVIGHSRISRENPSSTVDRIFSDFEQHVESVAAAHKGKIWNWAGDGGLIVFTRVARLKK